MRTSKWIISSKKRGWVKIENIWNNHHRNKWPSTCLLWKLSKQTPWYTLSKTKSPVQWGDICFTNPHHFHRQVKYSGHCSSNPNNAPLQGKSRKNTIRVHFFIHPKWVAFNDPCWRRWVMKLSSLSRLWGTSMPWKAVKSQPNFSLPRTASFSQSNWKAKSINTHSLKLTGRTFPGKHPERKVYQSV